MDFLESFVMKNAKIPEDLKTDWKPSDATTSPYKRFWSGRNMYVAISHWCTLTTPNDKPDDEHIFLDWISLLGEGTYQVVIEFPYVFYGRHKGEHLFSITTRITKVNFHPIAPAVDIDDILDEISTLPPKKKKKGRKAKNEGN